jgi:hypothetical protein
MGFEGLGCACYIFGRKRGFGGQGFAWYHPGA